MSEITQPRADAPPQVRTNPLKMLRMAARQRFADVMQMTRRSPVVLLHMGPMSVYLVSDPEIARHVLQENHLNYVKDRNVLELKHFLGEGLFTSEGEFWKRQRRLAQPAFHRQQLAALTSTMVQATARMLDRWEPLAASGATFDLAHEMTRLTLTTVGQALFHHDLDEGAGEMGAALTQVLKLTNRRILSPIRLPMRLPTPANLRFRRALAVLDAHVARIIAERRGEGAAGAELLSMFLQVRDADTGEGMTDRQIRDEVMTMVLAGHDTTANALSWAFHLLSTHPAEEARLRAELDAVLGGRAPAFEDLPRLSYTLQVFQEAMRLYPPVWVIGRMAKQADVLGGYPIPAGATVVVSTYALHHNPDLWDNPEGFDPDRFSPERSKDRPRFAYLPFGGGPRLCIGNNFAMMEAQIILAMVLQRHRVQLDPTAMVEPDLVLTMRPRYGIQVRLRPPLARPAAGAVSTEQAPRAAGAP